VADEGVGAVTFDSLGRKGGFSRGLATQRFGSKQGLIEAVIDHLHQRQDSLRGDTRIDDLPGLEAVLAFVDHYLRDLAANEEGRAYFMLLSSAVADASELRAVFAAAHARVERRLEAWVLRGQAEQLLIDPTMNLDPIRLTSLTTLRLSFGASDEAEPDAEEE
jgi:AcrR family transcriptional regulator